MVTAFKSYGHGAAAVSRVVAPPFPVAVLAVATAITTWREQGSIASPDWLPLAILAALIVATVAAAGAAVRAPRSALAGAGALMLLAGWMAVSISWSPTPAGAHDEAMLTGLYAIALLVPLLTLAAPAERLAATAVVVTALAAVGTLTAVDVARSSNARSFFFGGRLDFPVTYVNGCSALFALGVWPAIVLAARRPSRPAARVAAFGTATLFLALAVAAQSKGTMLGLAVSALVVFGLAPTRLRLLVPMLLAAAPVAAAVVPLTAPYRSSSSAAAHQPGWAALAVVVAGCALGAAYVVLDRRLEIGPQRWRSIVRILTILALAVPAGGAAAFLASVHSPGGYLAQKWHAFTQPASLRGGGSTHFSSLGSNRYDFWRVAIDEARAHPLQGIGGRGFYSAYLKHRRSPETPLRSHSLYLDALTEEGVPGLALLLMGIGAPFALLVRRREQPTAVAALGSSAYFFAHAGVDWIWTLPVVGVPAFLLLGIGCAGDDRRALPRRASLGAAAAAFAVALLAFAPSWLSYQYVTAAYHAADPAPDLRRAKELDPLTLEPYWAQWRLARTPAGQAAALESARRIEPDSVAVLYQLGLVYLREGRRASALEALRRAALLDPRDSTLRVAIRRASA
jgi:O-antigen ligase